MILCLCVPAKSLRTHEPIHFRMLSGGSPFSSIKLMLSHGNLDSCGVRNASKSMRNA